MKHKTWTLPEIKTLYKQPFPELLFQAQQVHREHFDASKIQASTLMNIKMGACPEDCSYCSQSGHHNTGLEKEKLSNLEKVKQMAKRAKAAGATRFCLVGAWRTPPKKDMDQLLEMIKAVKTLDMECCTSAGMLNEGQTHQLKNAGLDDYNHNIDTSERYYSEIIKTRTFQDRLDTLENVREAGIKICCGGILGLGETVEDRLMMLQTLANLETPPESVPINQLVPIPGTPLGNQASVTEIDFVRIIAITRILMPTTMVRLSAGRASMSDSFQTLCFLAGANSIHFGEKLLTTENKQPIADIALMDTLNMQFEEESHCVADSPA